ncbi:Inorganic phosphate transporter 1-4, partial [Linum grandiflorum]
PDSSHPTSLQFSTSSPSTAPSPASSFFEWLGDKMGRKRVYGLTLMLMVICSIAYGFSFSHEPKTVMTTLCFFRFLLGYGIGSDYPLSATIM